MDSRGYQLALDDLGVGAAQLAFDGQWLHINRRLCDLTGYSPEELLAMPFDLFFKPREPQTNGLNRKRLLNSEIGCYSMERNAVRKDGSSLWVRIVFSLQRDPTTNQPRCILAVFEDLTALRSAQLALQEAETARREMAGRITTVQDNERTRIARELHDDIGQSLAILRIQMMRAGQPVSGMPGKVHPGLSDLSVNLNDIAQKVSRLSHQLHSSKLEYLGLEVAVKGHCREFSEEFKIAVQCRCQDIPSNLDSLLALGLLRVIQEALHNAGKYSRARTIEVALQGEATEVSLLVADNGVGFDVEEARLAAGVGLISMRERIHLAGGEFVIESKPGEGTRITARVPLTGAAKPDESL